MKKFLMIGGLLATVIQVAAYDYGYLIVKQQNGMETSIPTTGLVMTFADGQLSAKAGGLTTQFELSQLASMRFSQEEVDGIDNALASAYTLRVSDRLLQVQAPAGTRVLVSSVSGMLIDRYTAGAEPINTPLRPGVYVVRVNDKCTKIHVR
ncbi:MAG: hypothetical protein IJV24_01625 [Prevotella sp.]|nr:hypothetical protein [Prevotella sp.]